MSLDLQIQNATLLALVEGNVQQALDTTCVAPFPPFYLDHADVAGGSMTVAQQATQFQVPVNIFLVDQTSLKANANGTPPGALTAAAQATLTLELTVQGAKLSLLCTGVFVTDPAFQSAAQQIQQSIGTIGSVDLSSMFTQLGLPSPTSSSMQQIGTSLLVRFDPGGAASDHLQIGEDWCAFIDAATMVALAISKVPLSKLSGHGITGLNTTASWAPSGTTPHVNVQVTGAAEVPNPFSGNVELDLGIDFLLQHVIPKDATQSPSELEELVNWSLSIDLGEFVPGFIDDAVASIIASELNPATFGGTAVGPNAFTLDSNLPPLVFGGATLAYTSLIGLQDGMVLGGPVQGIVPLNTAVLSIDVGQFPGSFSTFVNCLEGGPPPPPTLGNVSVRAVATYSGAGKLCAADILAPTGFDISPYLAASPAVGSLTDSGTLSFAFSGTVSYAVASLGQPVEVLLRTTRGVRILNFGLPPTPQFDQSGNVTNQSVLIINNCPGQPVPWWQLFHVFNPLWSVDPPVSWASQLGEVESFASLLITLHDVAAGDVVTFNQPLDGGLSFVTPDENGNVVMPVLMAVRSSSEQAILSRASRSDLGTFETSSVFFQRVAVLHTPGALSHRLTGDSQRATIVTTFENRTETTEIDSLGILRLRQDSQRAVTSEAITVAAKQSYSKTGSEEDGSEGTSINLPGLVRVLSVPGHETSGIAVAQLDDGTYRALVRQKNGSARFSGMIARWTDMPAVSGDWAISSSAGNRIAIFSVRRAPESACECHGQRR